jgi:hypothetical protein
MIRNYGIFIDVMKMLRGRRWTPEQAKALKLLINIGTDCRNSETAKDISNTWR